MLNIAVVIVAGGSGTRMGATVPKQFLCLNGKPILMHTIERFSNVLPSAEIIVVIPEQEAVRWQELCDEYKFCTVHKLAWGGSNRFESVKNGLRKLTRSDLVAVHDGVRPLVSARVITQAVELATTHGAAIPVVKPVDSLRKLTPTGSKIVDRSEYLQVQTPQVFRTEIITAAYERSYEEHFTDDASVVEATGHRIALSEGDYTNLKITREIDMIFAEAILRKIIKY